MQAEPDPISSQTVDPQAIADEAMQDALVLRTFDEIGDELGLGGVPNIFKVLAQSPEDLKAVWHRFKSSVLAGRTELDLTYACGLLAARAAGSNYAIRLAERLMFLVGCDSALIRALREGELDGLDERLGKSRLTALQATRDLFRESEESDYLSRLTGVGFGNAAAAELVASSTLFYELGLRAKVLGVPVDEDLLPAGPDEIG